MTILSGPDFHARSDGPAPEHPSFEACAVCGWHALSTAAEPATAVLEGRLVCTVCGAHHLASR